MVAPASVRPVLNGRELLVIQLRAKGYSQKQVAELLEVPLATAGLIELSACRALGTATTAEAIEVARDRRLIV
jgi:DNA-binding NarL/FixJ family response regulator